MVDAVQSYRCRNFVAQLCLRNFVGVFGSVHYLISVTKLESSHQTKDRQKIAT